MNFYKTSRSRAQHLAVAQLVLLTAMTWTTGCSVLVGNVKPVEDKSDHYRIMDLSRDDHDWTRFESNDKDEDHERTDITDFSYQSKSTASIISINTACREGGNHGSKSLREYTRELLLGISDQNSFDEHDTDVNGTPALETTIEGKLNPRLVKIRTVVLQKDDCVYDLMYIAKPELFVRHEALFSRFVHSLRLK